MEWAKNRMYMWLIDWLVDWLVDRLIDPSIDRSIYWFIDWFDTYTHAQFRRLKWMFVLLQCGKSTIPCTVQGPTLRSDGAGDHRNDAGWGRRRIGFLSRIIVSSRGSSSRPPLFHLSLLVQRSTTRSLAGLHLQSWRWRATGDALLYYILSVILLICH